MLKNIWQNLALAILVTAGVAILWGFFAVWGIETYERRTQARQSYKSLAVGDSGEAWIQVNHFGSYMQTPLDFPYRTLDGQPLENPSPDYWLTGCRLPLATGSHWTEKNLASNWRLKVSQVANTSRETWYLVHNGKFEAGRCYLIGYDRISKMPIGYCGQQGFRNELPAEAQWFRIDGRAVGYGQGGYARSSSHKNPVLALATQEGLFEFDVRQKTFRTIDDSQPYLSVNVCQIPRSTMQKNPDDAGDNTTNASDQDAEHFNPVQLEGFAARLQDQIVAIDPRKDRPSEFIIPEEYRDRSINFYFVSADQALLETSRGPRGYYESLLVWTNAAGEVEKTKPIDWNRVAGPSGSEGFLYASIAAPLPVVVGTFLFGMVPFSETMTDYSNWQEAGYLQRLGYLLADAWPMLLLLCLVAAGLTWLAVRWHRQYSRLNLRLWAAFVFLLGVPGFFTYWVLHRKPKLESCSDCGASVPHDRDACARCQQQFPEPSLLGTEVFA